ncbi:GAT domain-containing protein [Hirsutella rhossiliensis]|uniref:GAT domain-containing protein n=1 Tax=Hirsutella rhossiliensis TaxID=111463 RepID=A0A9P8MMB9_9HYPO|nr:GAT domain-containing protein [Hirsutella rhossiliensis]KAH0958858.1 GAT domain-containing protein [Hirsutella rhossiliensis]
MKAMKGLSMNKMLGSIKRKAGGSASSSPNPDNPEVTAHNSVKAFCESGGNAQSDEVLFLPPIVDAAESSPAAAAECARVIRKYLGKDYFSRPSWQYNALMLVRILTDNPGETFTRNLDDKFADTAKSLLKNAKDLGVRQLMMETLDDFEHTKVDDPNLGVMVQMWKKEKEKALKDQGGRMPPLGPRPSFGSPAFQSNSSSQNYFAKSHSNNQLPNAVELASRLEEARTSAKLLEQVVMNTPPAEMMHNDLIREFANRCLSASRSIQGYMTSENPAPDNDTMESLIDTNEQLQTALNQHQRAVLSARKQLGPSASPSEEDAPPVPRGSDRARDQQTVVPMASGAAGGGFFASGGNGKGKQAEVYNPPDGAPPKPPRPGQGRARDGDTAANPFEDPFTARQAGGSNDVGQNPSKKEATNSAPRHPPPQPPLPPPPPPGLEDDDDLYAATPKSKRSVSKF